jgi:hypothetical protein
MARNTKEGEMTNVETNRRAFMRKAGVATRAAAGGPALKESHAKVDYCDADGKWSKLKRSIDWV